MKRLLFASFLWSAFYSNQAYAQFTDVHSYDNSPVGLNKIELGCAYVRQRLDRAVGCAGIPNWNDYTDDFHTGVPLLHSSAIQLDLSSAGACLVALAQELSSKASLGGLAEECHTLHSQFLGTRDAPRRAIAHLLEKKTSGSEPQALTRYLGLEHAGVLSAPGSELF